MVVIVDCYLSCYIMSVIEILSFDDVPCSSSDIPSSSNNNSPSSNSNSVQQYSTSLIEGLLKQSNKPKQFIVIKNDQKKLSSPAWSTFGFPAKRIDDNSYKRIDGFASCFECKATYSYQSGGTGSTKHLLKHVCSKTLPSSENKTMGPMDKFIATGKPSSVKITAQDQVTFRDELTKWICSSIRPFNLVADPGFTSVLQTVVDMCELFVQFSRGSFISGFQVRSITDQLILKISL